MGKNQRTVQIHGDKIYEYENGLISQDLSYKTATGHYWYSVGDIILTVELPLHKLQQLFPELGSTSNQSPNLAILALAVMGFININQNYNLGWKIIQVNPSGGGEGQVVLKPALIFDSGAVILERTDVVSRQSLAIRFFNAHLAKGMAFVSKVLYGVSKTVVALMPVALSSGGPAIVLEKILAKGILKSVLKKMITETIKSFLKAVMAIVEETCKELERENLKTIAGMQPADLQIIFLRAAEKGAEVFIVELWLNARLKKVLDAFYPVEVELIASIKKRFVAECAASFFAVFAKACLEVFVQMPVAVLDKKEGIARLKSKINALPEELYKEMAGRLWTSLLNYHNGIITSGESYHSKG